MKNYGRKTDYARKRPLGSDKAANHHLVAKPYSVFYLGLVALFFFFAYQIWSLDMHLKGKDKSHIAYREANFQTVCPDYFKAGFSDRWFSDFGWENAWCEDYKDRL